MFCSSSLNEIGWNSYFMWHIIQYFALKASRKIFKQNSWWSLFSIDIFISIFPKNFRTRSFKHTSEGLFPQSRTHLWDTGLLLVCILCSIHRLFLISFLISFHVLIFVFVYKSMSINVNGAIQFIIYVLGIFYCQKCLHHKEKKKNPRFLRTVY